EADADDAAEEKGGNYRSKKQRAEDARRRVELTGCEKEIARLEAAIAEANGRLADPANASDYELLTELSEQLKADGTALEQVMEQWLELTSEE
ncbi:ABC transporter, partial [Ruminococcaceae bacterium OttesenSCG-928-D13]|nr:ABC transporter [Ruminococcaceae bacterium OttesenSCG-928-D13]